jgi:hypothetical protein
LSETPIGVLGSVRQLEGALESTAATRAAAERRRVAIAAADDDAVEIARVGAETAAREQADAHVICSRVVETALALVLPADDESEA